MTATDDLNIHHEAYRQGFLAGARAMQEEAAKIFDDLRSGEPIPRNAEAWLEATARWRLIEGYASAIRALDPEKVGG